MSLIYSFIATLSVRIKWRNVLFHTGMMNRGGGGGIVNRGEIVTTHLQYTTKLVLNLNLVGGGNFC